jgi:tetratricopeptide (TPR) repeat protein
LLSAGPAAPPPDATPPRRPAGRPASPAEPVKPAESSPWWNKAWSHRRILHVADHVRGAPPIEVAFADVPTLGLVQPDGRDVRIVDRDAKEIPAEILASGFDDRALIAFAAPRKGDYLLYFGNPAAPAPKPVHYKAGLLLESRELSPGNPRDLAVMQQMIDKSPRIHGRCARPTLALGFNPIGPWNLGLFLFTGYLACPADGTYSFATNAIDASFILIDGQLVASWPGWHPPMGGAGGEHRGSVELKKGIHEIKYLNAFRAHGACTVGWQKPGDERLSPIPAEAFAGVYLANPGPAETPAGPVPDFAWGFEDDLGYEGRAVTAVRFRPLSAIGTAGCRWEFGDGVTSAEHAPLHLYLDAGTFSVTLRLGGATVTQKVAVRPTRGHLGKGYEQRIQAYARMIENYPTAGLSGAACLEMGQICHEARRFNDAARAFRAALEQGYRSGIPGDPELEWYHRLAEIYRDAGKAEDALGVFNRLDQIAANDVQRVRALYRKAEILYDDRDDRAGAEACCRTILDAHRKAATDYVRSAYIRSGEFALARGDREAARKILEDAESSPAWRRFSGDLDVTEGAHAINFEEYLRRGEFEAAEREILSWEWKRPTVLLGGLTRQLRGRFCLVRKWHERAVREFDRALAADPKAPFADETLYWKGLALEAQKQPDKARACFEAIVRQFPESQRAGKAKEKLAEKTK